METYKHTPYEESYFYRDVMQADARQLQWLKKYSEGMLKAQRPPDGNEYLRYFYKQAYKHITNRIVANKYK